MSPITPEQQESLNQDFGKLSGQEQAELILAGIIGRQLSGKGLELIHDAIARYMAWHEKQHPNFQTCEYCEFVKDNVTMFKVLRHWVGIFENTVSKK